MLKRKKPFFRGYPIPQRVELHARDLREHWPPGFTRNLLCPPPGPDGPTCPSHPYCTGGPGCPILGPKP
jgi:hypothetical protein